MHVALYPPFVCGVAFTCDLLEDTLLLAATHTKKYAFVYGFVLFLELFYICSA